MANTVAVVIPTITPRAAMLKEALASVRAQTVPIAQVIVEWDTNHTGAAQTRNRALERVTADWVAFLDDDDLFKTQHVERLLKSQAKTGADVTYPWFDLPIGLDPLDAEGKPFDPIRLEMANFIPITVLARTSLLQGVGGFPLPNSEEWPHPDCEDWGLWRRLVAVGAEFHHLDERTWIWRWHGMNTSGMGDHW